MMLRNVVVFPAPLRPTRQTSSPAATDRLMPLRMRLPSISTFRLDKLSITTTFSKPCSNSCSNPCSSSWARSHHGRYHGWVGEEGVGWHVGEKNACLQRDDAMRIPLNEVHVVLDLDDSAHARRPGGGDENFHDGMLVTARNAAGRLVQQDDGGIERKGAGDIEQFFLALRKCRRDGIELGTQPQDFSDALGIRLEYRIPLQGAKRIGHAAQARRDRDAKRFPYRQSGKDIDQLKRARHSEPCKLDRPYAGDIAAQEANLSSRWLQQTGDDIDQRRLAGAIWSDDRDKLAIADAEGDVAESLEGTKGFRDVDGLKQGRRVGYGCAVGLHFTALHCRCWPEARSRPTTPAACKPREARARYPSRCASIA